MIILEKSEVTPKVEIPKEAKDLIEAGQIRGKQAFDRVIADYEKRYGSPNVYFKHKMEMEIQIRKEACQAMREAQYPFYKSALTIMHASAVPSSYQIKEDINK